MIDLTHTGAWSAASMLEHAAARPDPDEIFDARAETAPRRSPTRSCSTRRLDAVTETVDSSSPYAPLIARDAVFDQEDEALLSFLERRAVND